MVDQIGTGNPADELIGDDRPPSRRSSAVLVVLVLVLGGFAVTRLLDPPAAPESAPPASSPTATPTSTPPATRHSAIPSPYASAYPASAAPTPAVPLPWATLPVGRPLQVDLASGTVVRAAGHTVSAGRGVQVVEMHGADGGPVLLVQDRGTTAIEQLRPDGSRLVLDQFPFEGRHPQGLAVDPDGSRVVYALTSKNPDGPYGLVVRDLRSGEVLVSRRTRLPFGVRAWTPAGIVLEVAMDPGGPPYVWTPGAGAPVDLPRVGVEGGPYLLAASPVSDELAMTDGECVHLATAGGADRQHCDVHLGGPAAWSPDGRSVVGLYGRRLTALDVASGRTTSLRLPRVFVRQITWTSPGTVLLAVTDMDGEEGAVLRCRAGAGCRLASLGTLTRSPDLVLSH